VISKIAKKGGWKQTLASPQKRKKNLFVPKKIFEMKNPSEASTVFKQQTL
jgi:hypothetical protein